jgi:hypothetical protein
MFELMSKVKSLDKETQQYMNLIKKLDNLKVLLPAAQEQRMI